MGNHQRACFKQWRLFLQPRKIWWLIIKEESSSTNWKQVKLILVHIMQKDWQLTQKNISITTVYQVISQQLGIAKLLVLPFQLVRYSTYSTDLAPSNYCLFPNMKKLVARKRFRSNENVIVETSACFASLANPIFPNESTNCSNVGWSLWGWEKIYSKN